jgi:hypothetical protein
MVDGGAALEYLDEAGGRTYLFTTELAVDWGFVGSESTLRASLAS